MRIFKEFSCYVSFNNLSRATSILPFDSINASLILDDLTVGNNCCIVLISSSDTEPADSLSVELLFNSTVFSSSSLLSWLISLSFS